MRIGELAALVGASTRTVRHYHHLGLLPEPRRLGNGYREYRLRDAVLLARIRRLAELGLSLDEIRDVLADDRGRELRELPAEGSGFAELDREMLALVDTTADDRSRAEWPAMLEPLTTPEALARGHELYRRLDALGDAAPDDPRVAALAADLAAHLPREMAAAMTAADASGERSWQWLDEPAAEVTPAQAEVFRLLVALLKEKT